MKNYLYLLILITVLLFSNCHQEKEVTIKFYHTTDIHSNFFSKNFLNKGFYGGGLARISTFIKTQRNQYEQNMIFMDGGDVLQGQPAVYYYNFVDTIAEHVCARMMNYLKYDVAVPGNHDIEAGHAVYNRWINECDFPVLGANIISVKDQQPYLQPYKIFYRSGIKIAVLGLITHAIPAWIPENLWSGLCFDEIRYTAAKWVPYINEHERPDVIVALIHSGLEGGTLSDYHENEALSLATSVPGIDVVFFGHDHSDCCKKVINNENDSVLLINPGGFGFNVSDVSIQIKKKGNKIISKTISGQLADVSTLNRDSSFMNEFKGVYDTIQSYVNQEIGELTHPLDARESFFGSSAFIDFQHQLQLGLTGADISFAAPLSRTAFVKPGKVYVRDMFSIYPFENLLYTMELTGQEIYNALEYCYGMSTNQMKSPNDHLLLIEPLFDSDKFFFTERTYTFDSAAGIEYTVDATKPKGQKVTITSKSDGAPFDLNKTYKVAVTSFQGSGGGGILTLGAGIPKKDLPARILFSTDKDLRYYMIEMIKEEKKITPEKLNQWKYIPEKWTDKAGKRDWKLLFG